MNTTKILQIVIQARDEATKALQGIADKGQAVADNLKQVGGNLIALGAAPTAALAGITKVSIDFESTFAGVRKTVDASEAEFQQLAQNFRDISKETPLAVTDLNKIGEIAGSLGISGVANLTKFTETIAQIGVTTNLTEEEAAMSFGRISNVMQEPIKNVDRMGATVVDLGNKFAATEKDITEFSERIAGAGKIAGLTTDEVFAIGAAMSSVGIEAEAGGTAVQKVLISMTQAAAGSTSEIIDNTKAIGKNTTKLADLQGKLAIAQQQQKEFGDKTKESTKMMKDAQIAKYSSQIAGLSGDLTVLNATQGQAAISSASFASVLGVTDKKFQEMFKKDPSKVFEQFINKLGKSGEEAFTILEQLDLTDQRLIRSFLSLSNAGDLVNRTFDVASQSWKENTALTAEAEKRYATVESQLLIVKNNLLDVGITLGSVVLPAIVKMIELMKPFIEQFAAFAQQHPTLIVGLLAIGAAIGALGIGMVALGFILPGLINIFMFFTTIISGVITVVTFLIGVLGGPLTVIILAVMALVALFALAWKNNWFGIREKTAEVLEWFQNRVVPNFKWAFNQIKDAAQAFGNFVGGIWKNIQGAIDAASNAIRNFLNLNNQKNAGGGGGGGRSFQHGGFVQGPFNQAVPAILHGGERVTPRNGVDVNGGGGGMPSVSITFTGPVSMDSESSVSQLAEKIINILGRQNELAAKGVGF